MVCECQARQHKLHSNCLSCGFVICQGNGKECKTCPWCKASLDPAARTPGYHVAVDRATELASRRTTDATRVLDEEADSLGDVPLLASFLGTDIEEERGRLLRLESKLHAEHQARLQVSMSEFLTKHNL